MAIGKIQELCQYGEDTQHALTEYEMGSLIEDIRALAQKEGA